jgi:hypothetical protein
MPHQGSDLRSLNRLERGVREEFERMDGWEKALTVMTIVAFSGLLAVIATMLL